MNAGTPLVLLILGAQADEILLSMTGHLQVHQAGVSELQLRAPSSCGLLGSHSSVPRTEQKLFSVRASLLPTHVRLYSQCWAWPLKALPPHLCGCAGDDKIAADASPVPFAKLGQSHEKQPVLLFCPGNPFAPLI